jgi:calcineurin-like phosphoesterase family protein
MGTTFFTADLHLGHANIIKFTGRPFRRGDELLIDEMDEALINNWNARIGDRDTVYVLGDFCIWRDKKAPARYFRRLKGRKILVAGNHDKQETLALPWAEVYPDGQRILKLNKLKLCLNHYSMQVWIDSHKGSWHLFGHSHNTCKPVGRSFDAGVDAAAAYLASLREHKTFRRHEDSYPYLRPEDYIPWSFEEVEKRMGKLDFIGIDQHGNRG